MKTKKTLSNWLSTKYLLIFRNEENLSEKSSTSFTYAKLIVFSFAIFIFLLILSLSLASTILSQWYDPRHATLEANKKLIQLSLKLDSLQYEVARKDMFINTFRSIMMEDFDGIDSVEIRNPQITQTNYSGEDGLAPIDSLLRREFEQGNADFTESASQHYSQDLQDIYFFAPISGIITSRFDMSIEHYGVDVVARTDEPVKSIADGSVIMADWTQSSGNIIAVQHRGNLISVYKHNAALLKKVGSFVSAGEIIAIIGNTGELTTGPHLHFELWYNGNPV
ncbi:MAG: M23 family metallopeptidase, partial [Cyclobacteriaceae bacterium]|nr:M23 family metallopeptidase [Cyclobacteriaceae bacterium]